MKLNLQLLIIALIVGCSNKKQNIERSFYYWKTNFEISNSDNKLLSDLTINKIYVRFFDVEVDKADSNLYPNAEIKFVTKPAANLTIVPVIYITNKSLLNFPINKSDKLAEKIISEVNYIANKNFIHITELQIDCDWTASTRNKFFKLTDCLKNKLKSKNIVLSATIRLHQVKFYRKLGIPNIDRGMLMLYNIGNINTGNKNSIFNATDFVKYAKSINKYPLPLDIALPNFSWGIHSRDNKIIELLSNWDEKAVSDTTIFTSLDSGKYIVTHSLFYQGFYFKRNDNIKFENVNLDLCFSIAQLASKLVNKSARSVSIFDYNTLQKEYYEKTKFDSIYNCFN